MAVIFGDQRPLADVLTELVHSHALETIAVVIDPELVTAIAEEGGRP